MLRWKTYRMVFKNNDGGSLYLAMYALYCIEHMHRLGFTVCKNLR